LNLDWYLGGYEVISLQMQMGSGRMAYGVDGTLQQERLKEDDAQTMQGCISIFITISLTY